MKDKDVKKKNDHLDARNLSLPHSEDEDAYTAMAKNGVFIPEKDGEKDLST